MSEIEIQAKLDTHTAPMQEDISIQVKQTMASRSMRILQNIPQHVASILDKERLAYLVDNTDEKNFTYLTQNTDPEKLARFMNDVTKERLVYLINKTIPRNLSYLIDRTTDLTWIVYLANNSNLENLSALINDPGNNFFRLTQRMETPKNKTTTVWRITPEKLCELISDELIDISKLDDYIREHGHYLNLLVQMLSGELKKKPWKIWTEREFTMKETIQECKLG